MTTTPASGDREFYVPKHPARDQETEAIDRIVAYTHALKAFIDKCEVKVPNVEEWRLDKIRAARLALTDDEWRWIERGTGVAEGDQG